MPRPLVFNGQRLPASYANFYIANGLVLVPTFNDPADRVALNTLARALSRTAKWSDRLHGADLGPGRAALHDAAAAGRRRMTTAYFLPVSATTFWPAAGVAMSGMVDSRVTCPRSPSSSVM